MKQKLYTGSHSYKIMCPLYDRSITIFFIDDAHGSIYSVNMANTVKKERIQKYLIFGIIYKFVLLILHALHLTFLSNKSNFDGRLLL